MPIPVEQLPIVLPLDLVPTGTGNPLAEREDFVHTILSELRRPRGQARADVDTLDCHFDALWLWVPVCVPPAERERPLEEIFALEDLRAWLPSERVVAGSDSGNFVFDQRIVTKALRDIGPLAFLTEGEPFAGCLFHEMVISDGRKMSKHLGNVVDPDALVERYGADTVRLAVLYAARPQKALQLERVGGAARASLPRAGLGVLAVAPGGRRAPPNRRARRRARQRHHRASAAQTCPVVRAGRGEGHRGHAGVGDAHSAVRNVMRLFDRLKDFEKRVLTRGEELSAADRDALANALGVLAQLLSPLAPHIAEELWIALGHEGDAQTPWPGVSSRVPA